MTPRLTSIASVSLFIILPFICRAEFSEGPGSCPPGYEYVPPGQCIEIVPSPSPSITEPVIVVPGILASLNFKTIFLDSSGGEWQFLPAARPAYQGLIERLEQAGLNVTVAHYDWRKPAAESALTYLKPIIDQVKASTNSSKVDIVAHSFGGIIAREYIQGPQYDQDIDQLITIGTPHQGSADAYLAREGGVIPDRWTVGARWYLTLVERSLNATALAAPLPRPSSLRTFFPSLQDLLPTQPFITHEGEHLPLNDLAEQNLYLENRNATFNQDLTNTAVQLTTLSGTGLNTLEKIPVAEVSILERLIDSTLHRWRDGHPQPDPPATDTTAGDQTVTVASAKLDDSDPVQNIKHDKLPEELQEKILQVLDTAATGSHISYNLPDSIFSTVVLSPVTAFMQLPDGSTFTCDHAHEQTNVTCLIDHTDPDSPKILIITNPPDGWYNITYTGTGEGEYTTITSYTDADETVSATQDGTTTPGAVTAERVYIGNNTISLIDDANYQALLKKIEQLVKQAKHDKIIKGYQQTNITRPVTHAQNDLRLYEHRLIQKRESAALDRLRDYYHELNKIEQVARQFSHQNSSANLANTILQLLEKIRIYSPPL